MRKFLPLICLFLALQCATSREKVVAQMAGTMADAEPKLRKKTVAILPIERRGLTETTDARALVDLLTHELVSTTSLQVAERTRLDAVLGEQQLGQTGVIDPKAAAHVGRLLSVDAVIIGSMERKETGSEVFLRLVDSETAVILKTAHGVLPPDKSLAKEQEGGLAVNAPTNYSAGLTAEPINPTNYSSTSSPKTTANGVLEKEDTPVGRLVDLSYRKGGVGGYNQVIGRVLNSGRAPLLQGYVRLQLLDGAGELIGTAPCSSPDQPILPKQSLPFSCLFKPSADFKRFKATLESGGLNFSVKTLDLSAMKLRFRKSSDSFADSYQLSGVIQNDADNVVTYPRVLMSLFDAKGKFIGSAYGFAAKKELSPGEKSPFSVTIYGYSLHGKPARYEAFYSALKTRR